MQSPYDGYEVLPAALDFLSSFGDLDVKYPNPRNPSFITGINLYLLDVLETISAKTVQAYSKLLQTSLSVIGETYNQTLMLMNADGKVYGVFEWYIVEIGDSGIEALEALCSGRELKKIPHPRGHQS